MTLKYKSTDAYRKNKEQIKFRQQYECQINNEKVTALRTGSEKRQENSESAVVNVVDNGPVQQTQQQQDLAYTENAGDPSNTRISDLPTLSDPRHKHSLRFREVIFEVYFVFSFSIMFSIFISPAHLHVKILFYDPSLKKGAIK